MNFLTQADIEDRRRRGWDESTVYTEPSPIRLARASAIIHEIEDAFRGVQLKRGVGLFEGQAIDDYATEEVLGIACKKDERNDWRRIETKHLNACYSSLSFFDPLGMRFHLPAFMCCDLRGEFNNSLEFSLMRLNGWMEEKFSLFTQAQKGAVAAYLRFLAQDIDGQFSREDIAWRLRWRRDGQRLPADVDSRAFRAGVLR